MPNYVMPFVDVGGRRDVYYLGCVLYEMLTGAPPHSAPSPREAQRALERWAGEPVDAGEGWCFVGSIAGLTRSLAWSL